MRRPGAAHSVAWKHHKREIHLGSRLNEANRICTKNCTNYMPRGARWLKRLEREFTDRKVLGSNPTSASRLPLSRFEMPGSIPVLALPSGGMAARQRKGDTAEKYIPRDTDQVFLFTISLTPSDFCQKQLSVLVETRLKLLSVL
ncbi:hypothetical protein CSKR_106651 [Clonorchis sinensis]|uniref:Uncharacterized protein n=1 Tax=Clonorchis sinensis TaxID=79923 RepID=A0A3R7D372_CLOSI|nr:hypothetical protein CSKR_106651 [Clonorchis sinensis]